MSDVYLENFSKETFNFFTWLKGVASKDIMREGISGFHVTKDGFRYEATDGFACAIAVIERPIWINKAIDQPVALREGNYKIDTLTRKLIALSDLPYQYPNVQGVFNEIRVPKVSHPVTINPKYMNNLIKGFDFVHINIQSCYSPIQVVMHGTDMPDGKYIGLIMPICERDSQELNLQHMTEWFNDVLEIVPELEVVEEVIDAS